MNPKRMHTILTTVLLLLVVATAIGLYFANQRLTTMAAETTKHATDIEVSNKQINIYELTKNKIESLAYIDEILGQVLPEDEQQSAIVAELSGFARRSNPPLRFSGIQFKDAPVAVPGAKSGTIPKTVKIIPIDVSFKEVNYEGVVDFLREVETNRRTMQVYNIGLKQNEEDQKLIDVTISMNLYSKGAETKEKP